MGTRPSLVNASFGIPHTNTISTAVGGFQKTSTKPHADQPAPQP